MTEVLTDKTRGRVAVVIELAHPTPTRADIALVARLVRGRSPDRDV